VVITSDASHVSAALIAKASVKDKMTATVITAIQHGRYLYSKINKSLSPYYNRRNDLSVVDVCLLCRRRVSMHEVVGPIVSLGSHSWIVTLKISIV